MPFTCTRHRPGPRRNGARDLLHLMQVKDGRVGRYVIVAPTEWNFHPQGAFVGELSAVRRQRAMRQISGAAWRWRLTLRQP